MKKKELAQLNKEEMKSRLVELRKELMKLQTQVATGTTPKSPGQIKQIHRNIARIATYLKQREVINK